MGLCDCLESHWATRYHCSIAVRVVGDLIVQVSRDRLHLEVVSPPVPLPLGMDLYLAQSDDVESLLPDWLVEELFWSEENAVKATRNCVLHHL